MMRLSLCPLLLPLAACTASIAGRYDLQSVDGEPLPYETIRYSDAEGVVRIRDLTSARLELNDDGTCSLVSSSADRDIPRADPELRRPPSTEVEECTWSSDGATVTLAGPNDPPDEEGVGSVADGVITLTYVVFGEEVVLAYALVKG